MRFDTIRNSITGDTASFTPDVTVASVQLQGPAANSDFQCLPANAWFRAGDNILLQGVHTIYPHGLSIGDLAVLNSINLVYFVDGHGAVPIPELEANGIQLRGPCDSVYPNIQLKAPVNGSFKIQLIEQGAFGTVSMLGVPSLIGTSVLPVLFDLDIVHTFPMQNAP